jgi:hypothetical protein
MGLLSGSASVARFQVFDRPREPDFDALAFEPIPPASERRESAGFVPMEPEAPYRIGDDLFAFRLRFDRIRPDPTAVAERADALARAELGGSGRATPSTSAPRRARGWARPRCCCASSASTSGRRHPGRAPTPRRSSRPGCVSPSRAPRCSAAASSRR